MPSAKALAHTPVLQGHAAAVDNVDLGRHVAEDLATAVEADTAASGIVSAVARMVVDSVLSIAVDYIRGHSVFGVELVSALLSMLPPP
jgi:hypothetical protein